MAEVQRRSTTTGDLGHERATRRKSGIFFFNRSFKKNLDSAVELKHEIVVLHPTRRLTKKRRPMPPASPPTEDDEDDFRRPVFQRKVSIPLASNPTYTTDSIYSFTFGSTSSPKGENDSNGSTPTTPTLGPVQDGFDLKRSDSGRSIPVLAQTSAVTVEAERNLSSSPKSASISLGEAAQKSGSPAGSIKDAAAADATAAAETKPTEDLPTPPDTPGPSSTSAAVCQENEPAEEEDSKPEEPQVEKKSFSEDADLEIQVRNAQGEDVIYAVRSHVLESASRVWKQSIPARTSDTIDLSSDSAYGLDILFSIAHYRFQSLPQQLDVGELYGTAVAADKYEAIHLLAPFVKSWLVSLSTAAESQSNETLVAGFVLGEAQSFARTIAHCAYNSSLSTTEEGAVLLDAHGKPWSEQPLTGEVIDLLAAVRLSAIEQIIEAVSKPVNTLLNPQSGAAGGELPRFCQAPGDDDSVREECEQLQLGSAIMSLTKAKLWPPPAPSSIQASPAELARTYADVRLRRSVEDGHAQCGFGHQDQFARILAQPAKLTPVVVEQLVSRAKQSGVYEEETFKALQEESPVEEEESAAVAE